MMICCEKIEGIMKYGQYFLLLMIVLGMACSSQMKSLTYTEKFEGLTQLVLASETRNVSFEETVTKSALVFLKSNAVVAVNSSATFDFYLDFDRDPYDIQYDKKNKTLKVNAPVIRVKKPIINSSTVSFPERGILVNEDREAVQILESLTDRFIKEGQKLLSEPYVQDKCREKAEQFFKGLCNDMDLQVNKVIVSFPDY